MGTLPHEAPRGLRSAEDLNLGEELIWDAGRYNSLQASLFTFMNRIRSLLIQLFLEATEHLEVLTFDGESCLGLVGPHLERSSSGI